MQPNYRTCPSCGSMQPQANQVCTQCGRPLPQGVQPGQPVNLPPQGYSAPVAPPQGYSAPPPPPGYGQPPAARPPQGYGQPAAPQPVVPQPAAPQPAAPPPAATAYGVPPQAQPQRIPQQPPVPPQGMPPRPTPPPKKKSKAPLIIILCAVAVVLIGGSIAALLLLGNGGGKPDTAQADYDALVAKICEQATPAKVGACADELADFETANPDLVEKDLKTLVNTCADYAEGDPDNERRYTAALRTLERLKEAENKDIAACADRQLAVVQDEYDEYISYFTDPVPPKPDPSSSSTSSSTAPPPSSSSHAPSDPFDVPPYDPDEMDFAELEWIDGELWYSFTFTNTSDRTIMFAEALVFCYDKNGNPVYDEYGDNWDWGWTYNAVIHPGESYELTDYLFYQTGENMEYIFPLITYVQFTDESEWGIYSDTEDSDLLYEYYDELNDAVDQLVKEYLG